MARPRKNRPLIPKAPTCIAGKIGHLPYAVRMELCRRMRDGEPGITLLAWLNSLPEVKERLTLYFKGRPVSSANLSNWRQSGYAEWLHTLPRSLALVMDRIATLG